MLPEPSTTNTIVGMFLFVWTTALAQTSSKSSGLVGAANTPGSVVLPPGFATSGPAGAAPPLMAAVALAPAATRPSFPDGGGSLPQPIAAASSQPNTCERCESRDNITELR